MAKVEIQYGTIIGKRFPVFDHTEKKHFTINAYKKLNEELIGKNKEAYVVFFTTSRRNLN